MNAYLIMICAVAALQETGFCLKCVQCQSKVGFECDGSSAECETDAVCASRFAQTSEYRGLIKNIDRGCALPQYCNQSFTLMEPGNKRSIVLSSCCSTEGCTPLKPNIELTGNGIKCPFCFSPGYRNCISTNFMECSGYENKCFSYHLTGGSQADQLAARGCTTEQLCTGIIGTIVPRELQAGKVHCTSSASAKTLAI